MIDFGGYCLWEGSQEAELRPQEADMGCRALVNGSDSCISAIIDWCFLGKSLVNAYTGTGCELIFTGCDTGATWWKRIWAVECL